MTSTAIADTAVETVKVLDLNDIAQLGRIEKTKCILKGVTVTLQSLSTTHHQNILANLPPQSQDPLARFTHSQVETLVYATVSVNNKKYADADRNELRVFYSTLQSRLLQEFYAFYIEIAEEQQAVIDSLKKT